VNNYPDDPDVVLLLCDDFRLEAGNKITLLGWFTGGDVRLLADAAPDTIMLSSICLVFLLRSGEGQFQASIRLISPGVGHEQLESPRTDFIKTAEAPAVHIVKITPFHPRIGTYVVELSLDGKKYQRSFKVDRVDSTSSVP
jgi:hypothetical protein